MHFHQNSGNTVLEPLLSSEILSFYKGRFQWQLTFTCQKRCRIECVGAQRRSRRS